MLTLMLLGCGAGALAVDVSARLTKQRVAPKDVLPGTVTGYPRFIDGYLLAKLLDDPAALSAVSD